MPDKVCRKLGVNNTKQNEKNMKKQNLHKSD